MHTFHIFRQRQADRGKIVLKPLVVLLSNDFAKFQRETKNYIPLYIAIT